jgi:type IV secretion system protein VirB10
MKLAMRLPAKPRSAESDLDPREGESAEIIDLASRTAYPTVTQRKGKSDAIGLAAGVAVVALLGMATLWGMNSARMNPSEPKGAAIPPPQPAVVPGPAPAQLRAPPGPAQPAVTPQGIPGPAPIMAAPPQPNPVPAANPYAAPTIVFDASALPVPVPAAPTAGAAEGKGNSANDFASRIGGVGGGPAEARVDVNPKTTVTQGTMIPAVLETAINTDVPGYVRAVVSQDVRSFDGTRVLVPRSSRLIGQYQSGLQGGQKRAYVIWTRLIRPDGVSVAIASPAASFDGSTGLQGNVNSHFFQRFGSAMLLSVVGGLSTIASAGTNLMLGGGDSASAAAVNQGQNIGPTVRVRQGEPIRVFTARDLDFSRVPQL